MILAQNKNFMSENERILVTGANGFIGSHLMRELAQRGYNNIWAMERYVTGRYAKPKGYRTVFGDLRNQFIVRNIIKQVRPDVVVHLGSVSPVSYSFEHPYEVLDTNLYGTINLAESCLRELPNFKLFLMGSSSEVYGFCKDNPKTEESKPIPNSPYSVSKLSCEHYLNYLHEAYDFPVATLRNFNSYGRKVNRHFFVEKTITQMLNNETCRLGDPEPIRDLLYVDDHVNSYLTCLKQPEKCIGETFNFCSGKGWKLIEVVDKIKRLTDFKGEVVWNTVPARPSDIKVLVGSYEKAKRLLGWEPKWDLDRGLEKTVDYWRNKLRENRRNKEERDNRLFELKQGDKKED